MKYVVPHYLCFAEFIWLVGSCSELSISDFFKQTIYTNLLSLFFQQDI